MAKREVTTTAALLMVTGLLGVEKVNPEEAIEQMEDQQLRLEKAKRENNDAQRKYDSRKLFAQPPKHNPTKQPKMDRSRPMPSEHHRDRGPRR